MKKLFLAVVLAIVSFATVAAQDWQVTISAADGLPGTLVEDKGADLYYYNFKSKLLTPTEAVSKVRITVAGTYNGEAPSGNNFTTALSELKVYDADGNSVAYTASSNADHNSLSGNNDGGGLPALNDGNYKTYWHSMWGSSNPVAEYHYVELALAKSVSSFSLEWASRNNNTKNAPTVVGVTAGTTFTEPFAELGFTIGDKITNVADIKPNKLYLIKANAPTKYTQYDHATGDVSGSSDEGRGAGYLAGVSQSAYSATPSLEAAVCFVPAGDGKYLLNWYTLGAYLANNPSDFNGLNGWAKTTANQYNSAICTIEPAEPNAALGTDAKGDFQIKYSSWFYSQIEGSIGATKTELYIGADPRNNVDVLKMFDKAHKDELEERGYCEGFGLPVAFHFSIYEANVKDADANSYPTVDKEAAAERLFESQVEVAQEYIDSYVNNPDSIWLTIGDDVNNAVYKELWGMYMSDEGILAVKTNLDEKLAKANAFLSSPKELAEMYDAKIDLDWAISQFVSLKAILWYKTWFDLVIADGGGMLQGYEFSSQPYKNGTYPIETKQNLQHASDSVAMYYSTAEKYSVAQFENVYGYCDNVITAFRSSKIVENTLPIIYDRQNGMPGNREGNYLVWNSGVVKLTEAVDGIRITVLDNNAGSGTNVLGGFPVVALGEIEVFDASGNKLSFTEQDVTVSCVHGGFDNPTADGAGPAGLVDGNYATYYHSPWGGEAPTEYVYIELSFPSEMDMFSIKIVSRDTRSLTPTKIALSKKGEKYDDMIYAEYEWNEKVGDLVKETSEITDDGIYILRGLLWSNEEAGAVDGDGNPMSASPNYISGVSLFHREQAAVRAANAFFLKKVKGSEDLYTVFSLAKGQYWASLQAENSKGADATLTLNPEKMAQVKIVKSTNVFGDVEHSFVIYEEQEGRTTTTEVEVNGAAAEKEFETPYCVYMQWSSGVAVRPVVDPQPGVGSEKANALEYEDNMGDAWCFNKKNGEGQWEIYKLTMDDPYFYLLQNLVDVPESMNITVGTDPGCVKSSDDFDKAYDEALEAIENDDRENAKKYVDALIDEIAALEVAGKMPIVEGTEYVFVPSLEYTTTKAMTLSKATVDGTEVDVLGWADLPSVITDAEKFVFEAAEKTGEYYIKNVKTQKYIAIETKATHSDGSSLVGLDSNKDGNAFEVRNTTGAIWGFVKPGTDQAIHQYGHGGGSGTSGQFVYYTINAGASLWYIKTVESATSVEDVVVEGEDVVSVSYYTTAGTALAAPVKGVNIVVKVYSNGVVEATKVLVK
ncbi:MAG: hypothetical protein IKD40_02700 [Bacteroidaceae bacterium]|nr:hypothetical protein [Bacteroidaceae bacterium]